ncbi:competence type IV pilus ATPase ComGA [Halalkalibacter kiskunsagensis]|uniref:Competence type IV pilus ATPase ComGA n=1 Tax=Halalkalibacter kiskunsagensis TaxID=1548599 RepID=A0ABV6K886_9BACI
MLYEIEQYSKQLLNEAVKMKVTDLHFIPEEEFFLVLYRLNGRIESWRRLPLKMAERLISHFKYRSGMDIGERRKPQSASMVHEKKGLVYSLRLSTLPTRNKESLVIRLLPNFTTQSLSTLSIIPNKSKILHSVSSLTHGLCLLSGPTGSGKTTTLYTIVDQIIQEGGKSVISIEDPVERYIPNSIQVEVNPKNGMTFDAILKASLRHDPDVILIGEIRDEETAALSIRASLTGHVVLATVHSDSCFSALMRMLDLGVSRFDLIECCKIVLSQRIITTKCSLCERMCHPFCERERHMSRAALYEVLKGDALRQSITNEKRLIDHPFVLEAKKAWALGYIEEKEVLKFVSNSF